MKRILTGLWFIVYSLIYAQSHQFHFCNSNFVDISSTGTALQLTNDGTAAIQIPFNFVFGNASSDRLLVSNNGVVLFGVTSGFVSPANGTLGPMDPEGFYVLWDDYSDAGGGVYWQVDGTAPNRRVIIQWHRMRFTDTSVPGDVSFELILEETTNNIYYIYYDLDTGNANYDDGASATIGLICCGSSSELATPVPGIQCILYAPVSTAVGSEVTRFSVSLYPNPSENTLFYESKDPVRQVKIWNTEGKLLYDAKSDSHRGFLEINALKNGIYYIQFILDNGVILTRRFIKS